MKGVKQTIFNDGDKFGNCFSTCIASILELPANEVPNFMANRYDDYWTPILQWLRERGWLAVEIRLRIAETETLFVLPGDLYVILSGKSPRGDFNHAIIGKAVGYENGRIKWDYVHDPHPDNTFIVGDPEYATFVVKRQE